MEKLKCIYDSRWAGNHGIGRFSRELKRALKINNEISSGRPMSPFDSLRLAIKLIFSKRAWFFSPGYNGPLFSFCPFIITIHDLNHIDRPENGSFLKSLYYKLILKRMCKKALGILTVSEFSKRKIVSWSGVDEGKIFVVGNGVSTSLLSGCDKYAIDSEYIFCVGNRKRHKNEVGALRAFHSANIPVQVKIIFTGCPSDEMLCVISELNIEERVFFVGEVDDETLTRIYRGALFLLFPSFYEGFGLPIVEAFACGTPVITSNITAMPEIAGDAALLVDPYDISSMSSAISNLYYNNELRTVLINRGFSRAKDFTWRAVAEKVEFAISVLSAKTSFKIEW